MRSLIALLLLSACGPAEPCDDVHDLAALPDALRLTQQRHPAGWGSPQCMQCHPITTVHVRSCISIDNVDVAAINDELDPEDTATCVRCHGGNGVPEWAEEGS